MGCPASCPQAIGLTFHGPCPLSLHRLPSALCPVRMCMFPVSALLCLPPSAFTDLRCVRPQRPSRVLTVPGLAPPAGPALFPLGCPDFHCNLSSWPCHGLAGVSLQLLTRLYLGFLIWDVGLLACTSCGCSDLTRTGPRGSR